MTNPSQLELKGPECQVQERGLHTDHRLQLPTFFALGCQDGDQPQASRERGRPETPGPGRGGSRRLPRPDGRPSPPPPLGREFVGMGMAESGDIGH
jgi:hypothetical protein